MVKRCQQVCDLSAFFSLQNDQNFQKMEKAEILELTVNFLKMIRQQQMPGKLVFLAFFRFRGKYFLRRVPYSSYGRFIITVNMLFRIRKNGNIFNSELCDKRMEELICACPGVGT